MSSTCGRVSPRRSDGQVTELGYEFEFLMRHQKSDGDPLSHLPQRVGFRPQRQFKLVFRQPTRCKASRNWGQANCGDFLSIIFTLCLEMKKMCFRPDFIRTFAEIEYDDLHFFEFQCVTRLSGQTNSAWAGIFFAQNRSLSRPICIYLLNSSEN